MRLGETAACQSTFEKLVMPLAGNKFVVTATAMTKMFRGVPSCCQFRLAIIFVLMRETLKDCGLKTNVSLESLISTSKTRNEMRCPQLSGSCLLGEMVAQKFNGC